MLVVGSVLLSWETGRTRPLRTSASFGHENSLPALYRASRPSLTICRKLKVRSMSLKSFCGNQNDVHSLCRANQAAQKRAQWFPCLCLYVMWPQNRDRKRIFLIHPKTCLSISVQSTWNIARYGTTNVGATAHTLLAHVQFKRPVPRIEPVKILLQKCENLKLCYPANALIGTFVAVASQRWSSPPAVFVMENIKTVKGVFTVTVIESVKTNDLVKPTH